MSTILNRAKNALADLPESDQAELVTTLERSAAERKLKVMIAEGVAAIDAGKTRPLDIERIIKDAHTAHASST